MWLWMSGWMVVTQPFEVVVDNDRELGTTSNWIHTVGGVRII